MQDMKMKTSTHQNMPTPMNENMQDILIKKIKIKQKT
jgi:hypothetical protein